MRERGAFGKRLGDAFHLRSAPTLVTRSLQKSTLAVTELKCDQPNTGKTNSIPREDAYLIALQLRACHDHDLYFDGRLVRPTNFEAGVTSMYDLRRNPIADLRDPSHCLMFYLPRQALDNLAFESGAARIGDLKFPLATGIDDPVIRHLLSSLLPAMANPENAHPLFLDHVGLALSAHIAHVYGKMTPARGRFEGGLAAWQQQRAIEVLTADLKQEISLNQLAEQCGVSVRHFARAFRESTGMPPHRWLLKQRIDRALAMLPNKRLSLAEIASFCGFSDQSHFTRVFTRMVGMSPGVWRRANGFVRVPEQPAQE